MFRGTNSPDEISGSHNIMAKFTGKVAVITGGNSGMGLAVAKELAAGGAQIVIAGRDQKTLDAAIKEIGGETLGVRADISKLGDIENLFQQASEKFGKIDILFVNAGVAQFAPLEQVEEAVFDSMVNINFKGSFFTVQYALPHLNDGASIIFSTTAATKMGIAGTSVHTASRAAVDSLRKTFAAELVERGIRVNSVSPGPIETPIYERSGLPAEVIAGMKEGMTALIPMKRFGTPEEVAKAVAFLACDDSSYITGSEISVDGGMAQL